MKKLQLSLFCCCLLAAMALLQSCDEWWKKSDPPPTTNPPGVVDDRKPEKKDIIDIQKMADCKCVTPMCASTANACSNSCMDRVLECHEIDSLAFDTMITKYKYPGKQIDTAFIGAKLRQPGVDCANSWIKVESAFAPGDANNNDIDLDVKGLTTLPPDKRAAVKYRIPLFKGALSKKPTRILFFKAEKKDCDSNVVQDIVFKLEYNEAGKVSQFYDLSEAPPTYRKKK